MWHIYHLLEYLNGYEILKLWNFEFVFSSIFPSTTYTHAEFYLKVISIVIDVIATIMVNTILI